MSLNKDQIQKLVLLVIAGAGMIYAFWTFMLTPAQQSARDARQKIEQLRGKISEANRQIRKVNALEEEAQAAEEVHAQLERYIPSGSPIAWFPPRMNSFLRNHGIDNVHTKLGGSNASRVPDVDKFYAMDWVVQIPEAGYIPLGYAIAALENEQPLLRIEQVQISFTPDSPEKQRAELQMETLVKKQ